MNSLSLRGGVYDPRKIVLAEIQSLTLALRTSSKFTSKERFQYEVPEDNEPSIMRQLNTLKKNLSFPYRQVNTAEVLAPFFTVITNEETTGPITGVALSAIHKFLIFNIIRPGEESSKALVKETVNSVCRCRFEVTDSSTDEAVMNKLLQVLVSLVTTEVASLLDGTDLMEIAQACFRVGKNTRPTDLLRRESENSLQRIVHAVFSRYVSGKYVDTSISVDDIFLFVCSLCNPTEQGKSASVRLLGLQLALTVLETVGTCIASFPALLRVSKDSLSRALLSNLSTTNPVVLCSTLRTIHTLVVCAAPHLHEQLEAFLHHFQHRLSAASSKGLHAMTYSQASTIYENEELVLEELVEMCREPGFPVHLFAHYDLDVYAFSLFEDLCTVLSKNASPPPKEPLNVLHILSLEALLGILRSIADRSLSASTPAAHRLDSYVADCQRLKQENQEAVDTFNQNPNPKKSIETLQEIGVLSRPADAMEIAMFLRNNALRLDKAKLGEYLGEPDELCTRVLREYTGLCNFHNQNIEEGLRHMLSTFQLPGEAQKIGRILEAFAEEFFHSNSNTFLEDKDAAYVFAYSTIMLHTDLHNSQVKRKMTLPDFIRNNRGINAGKDIPQSEQERIFWSISQKPMNLCHCIIDAHRNDPLWEDLLRRSDEYFQSHPHAYPPEDDNTNQSTDSGGGVVDGKDNRGDIKQHPHISDHKIQPLSSEQDHRLKTYTGTNDAAHASASVAPPSMQRNNGEEYHNADDEEDNRGDGVLVSPMPTCCTPAYDYHMFLRMWPSALSAITSVLERTEDLSVADIALRGLEDCAQIAFRYAIPDVLDNLVIGLCKFTSNLDPAHPDAVSSFCRSVKAQKAIQHVFHITQLYGNSLRNGWKNILDLILRLFELDLLPEEIGITESFNTINDNNTNNNNNNARSDNNNTNIITASNISTRRRRPSSATRRSQSSSSVSTGSAISLLRFWQPVEETVPEVDEATLETAKDVIRQCHVQDLLTDAKMLEPESLHFLVTALVHDTRSVCETGLPTQDRDAETVVFCLSLLVDITIANTDRLPTVWTPVFQHVRRLLHLAINGGRPIDVSDITYSQQSSFDTNNTAPQQTSLWSASLSSPSPSPSPAPPLSSSSSPSPPPSSSNTRPGGSMPVPSSSYSESGYSLLDGSNSGSPASSSEDSLTERIASSSSAPGYLYASDGDGDGDMRESAELDMLVEGVISAVMRLCIHLMGRESGVVKEDLCRALKLVSELPRAHIQKAAPLLTAGMLQLLKTNSGSIKGVEVWDTVFRVLKQGAINDHARLTALEAMSLVVKEGKFEWPENVPMCVETLLCMAQLGTRLASPAQTIQVTDMLQLLHRHMISYGPSLTFPSQQWVQGWLSILRGIGYLCASRNTDVRNRAIATLQKALFEPALIEMNPKVLETCFNGMFFLFLRQMLERSHQDYGKGHAHRLEETRMRAWSLFTKVFLQFLHRLRDMDTFEKLWTEVLDVLLQYAAAANADDDSVLEPAKNMLLVMSAQGVFAESSPRIWQQTKRRLSNLFPDTLNAIDPERDASSATEGTQDEDNEDDINTNSNDDNDANQHSEKQQDDEQQQQQQQQQHQHQHQQQQSQEHYDSSPSQPHVPQQNDNNYSSPSSSTAHTVIDADHTRPSSSPARPADTDLPNPANMI